MPYDSSLDEQLFSKVWENENGKVAVSVYSYNNGPKKLQISREIKDRNGNFTFAKLGRLAKEELEGILPLIQEAARIM
jgi:predicted transcriptional regulator